MVGVDGRGRVGTAEGDAACVGRAFWIELPEQAVRAASGTRVRTQARRRVVLTAFYAAIFES